MVSDTKITYPYDGTRLVDEARTRHTYENGLVKIVILREDVAVGVAGDYADEVIRRVIAVRDSSLQELLDHLHAEQEDVGFVVAALNPARLWMVHDGEVEPRASGVRAWAGDQGAYGQFQENFHEWDDGRSLQFRLMSSMQRLTSLDQRPSVGGYTIQASGESAEGFLFDPVPMVRMPEVRVTGGRIEHGRVSLTLEVPPGGDTTTSELIAFVGRGETRGAIGLLHPLAGAGRLFRHESPYESATISTSTPEEFVRIAREEHGQELVYSRSPQSGQVIAARITKLPRRTA